VLSLACIPGDQFILPIVTALEPGRHHPRVGRDRLVVAYPDRQHRAGF
jgi:hypothetical protein